MEKYYVKAPISGWHEVNKEHFEAFVGNMRKHSTPPTMTIDELIASKTRIVETGGKPVARDWPPAPDDGRPEKKTLKHLGDITKINGAEVEPVWCITGGSPCQDLSIAGKRAGLAGARSGLYMEQIRIVKEMREHDRSIGRTGELVRPRYMVWENVPGAFSSNFKDGFGDFGAVLEEAVRIAEPGFSLPRLPDKQKWTKAGGMLGDGWSVAWRTHDAQYWGVPQRRRRISMVVDFNGSTAGDILFERFGGAEDPGAHEVITDSGRASRPEVQPDAESVRRDPPEGGTAREETAGGAENCSGATIFCLQGNGIDRADTAGCNGKGWKEDISYTLNTIDRPAVCAATVLDMSHACDVIRDCGGISPSLQARMGTGGNQITLTYQRVTGTLSPGDHAGSYNGQDAYNDMLICPDVAHALRAQACDPMREDATTYVIGIDDEKNAYIDQFGTLKAYASGGTQQHVMARMVVRRLTPLECTRLQGYPDGWVDIGNWTDEKGRVHKEADAPKYKALGNSIALPFWRWLFGRMAAYLPEGATLGSLFDGIGGFPLCWESIHGAGTARWASEIDEFPIAVTKHHFEESNNK